MVKYLVKRHDEMGHMTSRWEKVEKLENEDIPEEAEWVKVVLDWSEWAALKKDYVSKKRRIAGMKEAVTRWAKRAGDEAGERKLILAERRRVGKENDFEYLEHWTVPVPKNPALAREAWMWLEENEEIEAIKRMYYDKREGWIVVLRAEW